MKETCPKVSFCVPFRSSGIFIPALVEVFMVSVRPGHPDELRQRLRQLSELCFPFPQCLRSAPLRFQQFPPCSVQLLQRLLFRKDQTKAGFMGEEKEGDPCSD